jgi:hypothetical protein
MTYDELYTLSTEIRGGRAMDETVFGVLINLAKTTFERSRPWRKLVQKNSSNSATTSTVNTTAFTLPTNFIGTLPRRTMRLVTSTPGDYLEYTEVPYERWDEYKDSSGYFAIDHLNSNFYLSGTVSKTYTINFYYIGTTTTLATGVTWSFPAEFHPYLAFSLVAMDELGIDYDDISARQGNANFARAELIMKSAVKWDETLSRSAIGI